MLFKGPEHQYFLASMGRRGLKEILMLLETYVGMTLVKF
jgi:hypothetical protein